MSDIMGGAYRRYLREKRKKSLAMLLATIHGEIQPQLNAKIEAETALDEIEKPIQFQPFFGNFRQQH